MASHVEFMGLQASGKSEIYKEFSKLTKKNQNIISFEKALYYSLKIKLPYRVLKRILISQIYSRSYKRIKKLADFELNNPELYSFILKKIKEYGKPKWRNETLYGANNFFSLYQQILEYFQNKKDIIVFDEGFLQRGVSIFATNPLIKPKRKDIAEYIKKIPLPKIVFYISTDIKECIQRMKKRKHGFKRMKNLSEKDSKKVIEHMELYLNIATKELKKKGVLVLKIENYNLTKSIREIKRIINDYL
jgi:thymidylate kinase